MATMSVNCNFDGHLFDAPQGQASWGRRQGERPDPHMIRFRYLTVLCLALGQRGFTSMLVHPSIGEAVLCVPFARRPKTRLTVGAVESSGRWVFTYGSQWSLADHVAETAVRIIAMVTG
jgi:hypothetical protein